MVITADTCTEGGNPQISAVALADGLIVCNSLCQSDETVISCIEIIFQQVAVAASGL